MDEIKILVVEDDDSIYETYSDEVDEFDQVDIKLTRCESLLKAKDALLSNDFDGAIVDINLNPDVSSESSGNVVLKEIVEKHRFPVFVVSGNVEHVDADIKNSASGFLKFINKDAEVTNNQIFQQFLDIYKTGITKILGGKGQVEDRLNDIFWKHLAPSFDLWAQPGESRERALLRYTVSHLGEYLDIPDGRDRFYREAECYIKPPIRECIAPGDIVEKAGDRFILLSPACDVALRGNPEDGYQINANRVVLAPLIKVDRESFISHEILKGDENSKIREKILKEIVSGQRERFAFLPEYGDMYPSVIDFRNVHAWESTDFGGTERLATVSGVFFKDIQSKFSAYLGRQGQPDLDKARLVRDYKSFLAEAD